MPICSICLTKEANQTGSHMLSAFMIESTIGERGNEKGYFISDEPNFDYRNNTGAEPVVEDYLFCSGCEQRMAYVEGYICREYRDKIKTERFQQNFIDIINAGQPDFIRQANRVNSYAFTLFIATLLFRMSLSTKRLFHDFNLIPPEQEHLRVIINEALPTYENFKVKIKIPHFLKNLNEKGDLFNGLYFIIATYDHLDDKTMSFNLSHPTYRLPYNMMVSQVIILFFFEKPRDRTIYLDFFKILEERDILLSLNGDGSPIRTIILEQSKWLSIISSIRDEIVANKMPGLMQVFVQEFVKKHLREPTSEDWRVYIEEKFPD